MLIFFNITLSSLEWFLVEWQIDEEGGSLIKLTLHINVSFVILYDLIRDR